MRPEPDGDRGECLDCAPTAGEWRALGYNVSRRRALGFGAIGAAALAFSGAAFGSVAFAADYPSWEDVEAARANEGKKATEIARIEGLIQSLQDEVQRTQAVAEQLSAEFWEAQQDYFEAAQRATDLQAQADEEALRAADSADKAGRVAAQMYRNGGDDTTLELFFSGSAESADDLLTRLGAMDKLVEVNRSVYADAIAARDTAQSLTDQAVVARDERDELQKIAESKMVAAQDAAVAAQAAYDAQTEHLVVLQAQLEALKDTTAKTVEGYKAGVEAERKAREERERKAREEAARQAAAQAAAEKAAREKAAQEQAASNGGSGGSSSGGSSGGSSSGGSGGGGSSSGGGSSGSGGWSKPHSGWVTGSYGPRQSICSNGYCTRPYHYGIDLANGCGAGIYAAHSGTVVFASYNGSYGNYIKLDHGSGLGSGYAHIRPGGMLVGVGSRVSSGQLIAYAGTTGASTGCHLHFEVYVNGAPVNPASFMGDRGIYF